MVEKMIALNANNLLSLWEKGLTLQPVRRYLLLLCAAWPEKSLEEWAQASIGQRDEGLLSLRESLFGTLLEVIARCPACGEKLELELETSQLRAQNKSMTQEGQIEIEGYSVHYRLPNSADLMAATEAGGEHSPRDALLERCLISVCQSGENVEIKQLPQTLISAVAEDMARIDPQAEVLMAMNCPACQHAWHPSFDIAAYLWDEIGDWAARTLKEVCILARYFGWSERDILEMSARRRRSYLEMVGA